MRAYYFFFFFQAEDGIRDYKVTGVQTCALPILLAQMMIKMLVQHHAPASPGNSAKDTARWPLRRRSPISKAANQVAQASDVCLPGRWARGEKLGRAPTLPFGPRHDVDRQPVKGRVAQWTRGRRGLQLLETLPQIAAHMADHLWRCEAPPERLAIRCQAADPVEDRISGLGVEE